MEQSRAIAPSALFASSEHKDHRSSKWPHCFDQLFIHGELPIIAVQSDLPGRRYDHIIDINLRSLNRKIQRQYTEAGFPLAVSGVQIVGLPKREVLKRISALYPQQSLERWRPNLDAETALWSTMRTGYFHCDPQEIQWLQSYSAGRDLGQGIASIAALVRPF